MYMGTELTRGGVAHYVLYINLTGSQGARYTVKDPFWVCLCSISGWDLHLDW